MRPRKGLCYSPAPESATRRVIFALPSLSFLVHKKVHGNDGFLKFS